DEGKLMPGWIGPFLVTNIHHDTDNYTPHINPRFGLIHKTFHASLRKPFILNDNVLFPSREHARPAATMISKVKADNLFEIDHIREWKIACNGKKQYFVCW